MNRTGLGLRLIGAGAGGAGCGECWIWIIGPVRNDVEGDRSVSGNSGMDLTESRQKYGLALREEESEADLGIGSESSGGG